MAQRIPQCTDPTEVRQAFQRVRADLDILTTGGAGEILVGVGGGALPAWQTTLTTLTLFTCDNITIDAASITSDTGGISFNDDNLTTTGQVQAGIAVVDNITIDAATIVSDTGTIGFGDDHLTTTGNVTAESFITGTMTVDAGSITDSSGAISFGDENLTTTGFVMASEHRASTGFIKTGWPISPGVTLSFDDGNMRLTVTDGGSAFYYINGTKYTLGGNKSVTIDGTEGEWYFYFSGSTLTASQTPWVISDDDKALVAYTYWDATNSKSLLLGYELHGYVMDAATHHMMHHTGGAQWEDGLEVTEVASEQVNVSAGSLHDEDLKVAVTDDAGSGVFDQTLSPAEIPILYRSGASNWRSYITSDKTNAADVGYVDGSNDLHYNKLNGTWASTAVSGVGKYVAYWIVALNCQDHPVMAIMGQREDNTQSDAEANNVFSGLVLTSAPYEEMIVLARVILKSTAGAPYYEIDSILDLRATNSTGTVIAPVVADHGGLIGLTDDDHTQYSLVDGTRAFTGPVGGVAPVSDADLVTKEYVDQTITFVFDFYMNDTASDIGGIYYKMLELPTGEAASTFTTPGLGAGNDQALVNFATDADIPGTVVWKGGHYVAHIHTAITAGTKPTKIYWTLVRRETDTTETVIGTSDITDYLTATADPYYISLHLTDDVDVNVDDRLVVKFYANVEATGSDVDVTLYAEGDHASRLTVPVTTEIISNLYLRRDGSNSITGNVSVDALVTIDGRDLSVDGTKLDGIEPLADVTDATNVAAAGAAMSGGAFHDGFSDFVAAEHVSLPNTIANVLSDHDLAAHTTLGLFDQHSDVDHDQTTNFVANEHIDHTGVTLTAGSGLTGGGDISTNRTFDLDINSLAVATIAAGDFVPFWDITATATNKKITFSNFESTLNHDSLTGFVANEHIDWTSTASNLYTTGSGRFDGHVGIDVAAQTYLGLYINRGDTDQAYGGGITSTYLATYTDDVNLTHYNLNLNSQATVATGKTNTGSAVAVYGVCYTDSTHLGTQRRLIGNQFRYGIPTGSGGTVTYCYGVTLSPVGQAGTIGTMYDFSINELAAGGTVTSHWSFYNDSSEDSYFKGDVGLGQTAPAARLEVETLSDEGDVAIVIDQNDADQAFIDYQGTSAANASNSISTWTSGNSIQGFFRVEINGSTQWMPYYDAPTS